MSPGEERWKTVDDYLTGLLVPSDPALEAAVRESEEAGLPSIQVSPVQGKLLHLLARGLGARRVLEIGTLGGYSAIWLGRAIAPDGRMITLEASPLHAEVARRNLERAGFSKVVEVRVGPALESLPKLATEAAGPFDLTFIDADRPNAAEYLDWAVRLSHPGSAIVVDNVVRQGAVADPSDPDAGVRGIRRLLDRLSNDPRVTGTVMQTVGSKGYDGFALAIVVDPSATSRAGAPPPGDPGR